MHVSKLYSLRHGSPEQLAETIAALARKRVAHAPGVAKIVGRQLGRVREYTDRELVSIALLALVASDFSAYQDPYALEDIRQKLAAAADKLDIELRDVTASLSAAKDLEEELFTAAERTYSGKTTE